MRRTLPLIALFIGLTLHAQQDEWTSVSDINPFIGTGGHGQFLLVVNWTCRVNVFQLW